jgi:hypothetical protein
VTTTAGRNPRGVNRTGALYRGPMRAYWTVRWSDSRGIMTTPTLSGVRSEIAYFRRQGRDATPTITRTEICPIPGCNGEGLRWQPARRGKRFGREVPCVGCRGRNETSEDLADLEPRRVADHETLANVLMLLGYTYEHSTTTWGGTRTRILHNGIEVHCGAAGSTWDWLRETGPIV